MKKPYRSPVVLTEHFRPQEYLCACAVQNHNLSEAQQCGYPLDNLPYSIFAQGWTDCLIAVSGSGDVFGYCYQPGENNLFSS